MFRTDGVLALRGSLGENRIAGPHDVPLALAVVQFAAMAEYEHTAHHPLPAKVDLRVALPAGIGSPKLLGHIRPIGEPLAAIVKVMNRGSKCKDPDERAEKTAIRRPRPVSRRNDVTMLVHRAQTKKPPREWSEK